MWIERDLKKNDFLQSLEGLSGQVLVLRGARQVGKTSFIFDCLDHLSSFHKIYLNLSHSGRRSIDGREIFGRNFFGTEDTFEALLSNIQLKFGKLDSIEKNILVFIDEADQHLPVLEAIQDMAQYSKKIKVIITGSNLENVKVKNVATGRRKYFDLYPITFLQFLKANSNIEELNYINQIVEEDHFILSDFYHDELNKLFEIYIRLGGMPKILSTFLDPNEDNKIIPNVVYDLIETIEGNIKQVLGGKSHLYEYDDVLRKMAILSINTLKLSHLQVNHAGRNEARRLLSKTVGARVAHKIRLFDSEKDLSKYILFDPGVVNFFLNGSYLLDQKMLSQALGIIYETAIGNLLISSYPSRDDLSYWKSPRGAEVDFLLKYPKLCAIDVKSKNGDEKSLKSCAIFQPEVEILVKISQEPLNIRNNFVANVANIASSRKIPLVTMPHYLIEHLPKLLKALVK